MSRAAPGPGRYGVWLLGYALLVAYSSTVVGPDGLHFVAPGDGTVWREFASRAFTWVSLGSDQRADWIGNLMMGVPLGFLLAGAFEPKQGRAPHRLAAAGAAWLAALAFILLLKFAQLYFPPRTVTLNYVVAQGVGAAAGIAAHGWSRERLGRLRHGVRVPRETLRFVLGLYSAALFVFFLMPLDFALSRADLLAQVHRLAEVVVAVPGAERPAPVRAALLIAGAVSTVPFGVRLVLAPRGRNRSLAAASVLGVVSMAVLLALSTLVIGAAPALVSLVSRSLGVALGAWGAHGLLEQDPERLLHRLRSLSAWLVLPYLLLLLAVNGLLSLHWRGLAEALQAANPLGLLPLYDYYIVSKAAAAGNIVAHAVMYAPVGLYAWLVGARARAAGVSAFVLAFAVESARCLRPGLEGDINAVVLAAIAAAVTARAMPRVWSMLAVLCRAAGPRAPA